MNRVNNLFIMVLVFVKNSSSIYVPGFIFIFCHFRHYNYAIVNNLIRRIKRWHIIVLLFISFVWWIFVLLTHELVLLDSVLHGETFRMYNYLFLHLVKWCFHFLLFGF